MASELIHPDTVTVFQGEMMEETSRPGEHYVQRLESQRSRRKEVLCELMRWGNLRLAIGPDQEGFCGPPSIGITEARYNSGNDSLNRHS